MSDVPNLEIGFFDPLNDSKNNFTHDGKGLEIFYNDLLSRIPYKVDDFEGHFASSRIKIICFMLFLLCETFSNVYCILFIMFEKYGGDPLKRSVTNQVLFKRYQKKNKSPKSRFLDSKLSDFDIIDSTLMSFPLDRTNTTEFNFYCFFKIARY